MTDFAASNVTISYRSNYRDRFMIALSQSIEFQENKDLGYDKVRWVILKVASRLFEFEKHKGSYHKDALLAKLNASKDSGQLVLTMEQGLYLERLCEIYVRHKDLIGDLETNCLLSDIHRNAMLRGRLFIISKLFTILWDGVSKYVPIGFKEWYGNAVNMWDLNWAGIFAYIRLSTDAVFARLSMYVRPLFFDSSLSFSRDLKVLRYSVGKKVATEFYFTSLMPFYTGSLKCVNSKICEMECKALGFRESMASFNFGVYSLTYIYSRENQGLYRLVVSRGREQMGCIAIYSGVFMDEVSLGLNCCFDPMWDKIVSLTLIWLADLVDSFAFNVNQQLKKNGVDKLPSDLVKVVKSYLV